MSEWQKIGAISKLLIVASSLKTAPLRIIQPGLLLYAFQGLADSGERECANE